MTSLSTVQAAVVTLLLSAASVAFGLGAFSHTIDQVIVSAVGPIVGAIFTISVAIVESAKIQAGLIK